MVSPQLLRRFPGFTRALERSVRSVAVISQEKRFGAGEQILNEGDRADNLYFLLEGEVDLTFSLRTGSVVVDTLVPGDLMGWSSMVAPHSLTATAAARTEVRVISIDGLELQRLFERDCSLGYFLMQQVVSSLSHRLKGAHIQLAATCEA
jgi:CRP-like cAMP-binding protein